MILGNEWLRIVSRWNYFQYYPMKCAIFAHAINLNIENVSRIHSWDNQLSFSLFNSHESFFEAFNKQRDLKFLKLAFAKETEKSIISSLTAMRRRSTMDASPCKYIWYKLIMLTVELPVSHAVEVSMPLSKAFTQTILWRTRF